MKKIKGETKSERMAEYKAKQRRKENHVFVKFMRLPNHVVQFVPDRPNRIDLSGAGKFMSRTGVTDNVDR